MYTISLGYELSPSLSLLHCTQIKSNLQLIGVFGAIILLYLVYLVDILVGGLAKINCVIELQLKIGKFIVIDEI